MVAEVTVFPVPGGPWIRLRGLCSTVFTAYTCTRRASKKGGKKIQSRWDVGKNRQMSILWKNPSNHRETWSMWSDLWVIEVRQALSSEALWQLALDGDILYLMAQQFVVNVARHGGLVHGKCLQGALHPAATNVRCYQLFISTGNLCAYHNTSLVYECHTLMSENCTQHNIHDIIFP